MSSEHIQHALSSLVDTRPSYCYDNKFDFSRLDPPQAVSIIVSFHAEAFYDLKLTLSSIVEHTPYDLYNEIIILDDGTTDELISDDVNTFLKDTRFNKVGYDLYRDILSRSSQSSVNETTAYWILLQMKLFKSESHDGQSASWFKSSKVSTGEILIFVDSSVVVNHGWLQPLISKVMDDNEMIAVSHADNILDDDRFYRTDDSLVNVLTWSLSTVHYETNKVSSSIFYFIFVILSSYFHCVI